MLFRSLQTQRTILDLRAEVQHLHKELGAARAAQARLEGELRDAQRRVAEAQSLVEEQRHTLAAARDEREKAAQAGREAQGQLNELSKLRRQAAEAEQAQTRMQALESAVEKPLRKQGAFPTRSRR